MTTTSNLGFLSDECSSVTKVARAATGDVTKISDGERVDDPSVVMNGVDLSIVGSDFEDVDDEDNRTRGSDSENNRTRGSDSENENSDVESDNGIEPGEISSSDKEDLPVRQVASKVVKLTPKTKQKGGEQSARQVTGVKQNKYSHLKNDPEFREFLEEILGGNRQKRNEEPPSTSSDRGHREMDQRHDRH